MTSNVAIVNGYFDPYSAYAVWKYCERKHRYPDPETAEVYRQRREDAGITNLVVYFCTSCRGYHMGHKQDA